MQALELIKKLFMLFYLPTIELYTLPPVNTYSFFLPKVKVFDCVADAGDLGEEPAAGLQDIISARDIFVFPTRPAQFLTGATTPSQSDNLGELSLKDFHSRSKLYV